MTFPEEPRQSEGKDSSSQAARPADVKFPRETLLPDDFTPLVRSETPSASSPARRRRARRSLIPPGADERAALLEDLAQRAFPSVEFYLFAFLSGILLGAGFLLDSDALLLLGLLLAPLLTPWVGMVLAVVTGGWRFFLQTFVSLAIAMLLTFITSALVGWFNRILELSKFYRAADHTKLWWTDLLIVAVGAVLLVIAFMRGEHRPIVPSILVAYGLFLPVGAAGFGLGAALPEFWPNGVFIFLTHLALATLAGGIVLVALHFKPPRNPAYILPIFIGLLCVSALIVFTGLAGWVMNRVTPPPADFSLTPLGLVSPTPRPPASATPRAPTGTVTPLPSEQPSATLTTIPTPALAVIAASTDGGANVRTEPGGGVVIITLINGTQVEVLPESQTVGTSQWVRIRSLEGLEGWVLQAVLAFPTP
jgi:hypothetical protein